MSQASKGFVANAADVTGGPGGPADYCGQVIRGRELRLQATFRY